LAPLATRAIYMTRTGTQHKQLQSALLAAFDESGLRQLATFELNANLDHIAGGKDLTERVYNLVKWADEHGRVPELVSGALHQNPTSADLKTVAKAAKRWKLEPPAEPKAPLHTRALPSLMWPMPTAFLGANH